MNIDKIKPIPKYILKLIQKEDAKDILTRSGQVRYYSYLTKNEGEPVQITVACKNRGAKWRCKQVVVHGVHSDQCFLKDICLHFMGNYSVGWYEQGLQKQRKWYEHEQWGWQDDKYFNIYCPIVNIEYVFKFPEYKYSAADKYGFCDLFKYLRLYEKYPQAEMLVKFGLSEYATSVQILKKIGKDKAFRKWLINNRRDIRCGYYVSTILLAYKTGKSLAKAQKIEEDKKKFCRRDSYRDIKTIFRSDKEVSTFLAYIEKQNMNLESYNDYLMACRYLGLDMSLEKNRLPHDFKRWHDIRIDEYKTAKALKDAEERKEMYTKFATVAEKYLPLQRNKGNAFIVVIARSPQDLICEGEVLNHCVGRMNYNQRFIREESLIFFIRCKDTPDMPFVTVEYSLKEKRVLQCYGKSDSRPDDSVLEFVHKKWLPYANRKLKQLIA